MKQKPFYKIHSIYSDCGSLVQKLPFRVEKILYGKVCSLKVCPKDISPDTGQRTDIYCSASSCGCIRSYSYNKPCTSLIWFCFSDWTLTNYWRKWNSEWLDFLNLTEILLASGIHLIGWLEGRVVTPKFNLSFSQDSHREQEPGKTLLASPGLSSRFCSQPCLYSASSVPRTHHRPGTNLLVPVGRVTLYLTSDLCVSGHYFLLQIHKAFSFLLKLTWQ